jgi:tetratricopeptide (TPR) repeat protein
MGAENPNTLSSMNNLASCLQDMGKWEEAKALYTRCLELRRQVQGNTDADVADTLGNLASLRMQQRDPDGAERLYREALEIRRAVGKGDHPEIAIALVNVAVILGSKGDFAGAEPLVREALEIWRRLVGERHAEVARALGNLGSVLQSQGKFEESEPIFREALDQSKEFLPPDHPRTLSYAASLGLALSEEAWAGLDRADMSLAARADEAESMLRECLAKRTATLNPEDPSLAGTRVSLAGAIISRESVRRRLEPESLPGAIIPRLSEAESLLRQGHTVLAGDPAAPVPAVNDARRKQAVERFVRLYALWNEVEPGAGKAELAEEWRAR